VAVFDRTFSGLVSAGLKANPFNFTGAAPVQPSQKTQKGLQFGLQNLNRALGAAEGIPAMPAFGGTGVTPGFDIQNLFAKSQALGATPAPGGVGGGGGRPAPIVQAADEEYKRLMSQYGGAPGVQQLAGMTSLPTGFTPTGANQAANLKDYYAAQNLQGNANLGTIINAMGYTGDMEKWAQANPMLAQREYAKKFGMAAAGVNPVAGFGMPQQLAGETPAAYQGEPAGQVFAAPKPPVNPMLGYGLNDSLVSAVSPQADFSAKFGLNGNFGTPGTADNSVLAGAANFTPAPPAETQSKTDEFNNRVEATAGLRAKLSPQYSSTFNTPLNFSQYFNPGGQ
jgi:hypothetical protein